MKSVFVYGHVWRRNFGDELMTLVASLFLKQLGCRLVVYNLHRGLAEKYGLLSSNDLRECLDRSDVCVIAGGAFFSAHRNPKVIENSFELFSSIRNTKIPVFALSVGGDNDEVGPLMPLASTGIVWRENLFKAVIRSRPDFDHLQNIGVDVEYAPDILWSLYYLTDHLARAASSNQKKYGKYIAISGSVGAMGFKTFSRFFKYARGKRAVYFRTTPRDNGVTIPAREEGFFYFDPFEMVAFFQGADFVADGQLHPGVTSLAVGTPNLCVNGNEKSSGFYTERQWHRRFVSSSGGPLAIARKIAFDKSLSYSNVKEEVQELASASLSNFRLLADAVGIDGMSDGQIIDQLIASVGSHPVSS